jgi:hypothetical protein
MTWETPWAMVVQSCWQKIFASRKAPLTSKYALIHWAHNAQDEATGWMKTVCRGQTFPTKRTHKWPRLM